MELSGVVGFVWSRYSVLIVGKHLGDFAVGIPATDNDNRVIPRDLQLAAAEIAEVCRRYGVSSITADIQSGESYETMVLNWSQGRHGVKRDTARLTYRKSVTVEIDAMFKGGRCEREQ